MAYLKIETEDSSSDGNFSSILGVQYFFHPPVMANTLKVLWLMKGGHDSSQRCGRGMPSRVSVGVVVLDKGKAQ